MTRETVNRQSYSVSRQRPITNSMLDISAHKWGCTDNRYRRIIGRFADNRYQPIITSVSADYRLHTW